MTNTPSAVVVRRDGKCPHIPRPRKWRG